MNVIHYILFILFFLIMYSVCFKTVEGFDDEFYYYNKLIDYKTMPNSFVNDATPSRTVNKFGFYKGKGTFKKGYTKETKSDEKISTLNKLLNRLLGKIKSDNQDCVGSFDKYSECDKSCGSNSFQTRKYNITQERGKNGKDCPFVDGYEEQKRCNLDLCQLGDICKNNDDCETGNCNPNSTRCENMVPCDINNYNVCNETDCIELNEKYDNNVMREGTFIYNNVDDQCFFKTPAEIEKLNLNIFTFNYRTVSEQVENLELDCNYFQIKKDGVGPCVNIPNVKIEEGVPECLPGYGPEPTLFNGSLACSECIIPPNQRFNSQESDTPSVEGDDTELNNCYCENGGTFDNASMVCGPGRSGTSATLCTNESESLWFLKKKDDSPGSPDGSCVPACALGQQVRKSGSYVSCITCPDGSKPYSDYCRDGDNLPEGNVASEGSDNICSSENFKVNLEILSGGAGADITNGILLNNSYNEKCYDTNIRRDLITCPTYQSKIGDECKCTGNGMDRGLPKGANRKCNADNCITGYYWDSDSNTCVVCEDQSIGRSEQGYLLNLVNCSYSIPGTCVFDSNTGTGAAYNKCRQCKTGYVLSDSGMCDSCDVGFNNSGTSNELGRIICTSDADSSPPPTPPPSRPAAVQIQRTASNPAYNLHGRGIR